MNSSPRKFTHDAQDESTVGRRGVEARILHNGLLLNDTRVPDYYRITEITGLDDVDVRDVREDNPDRDGETAYSAFGGGRTVTLRGYIKAGNFAKLRQMEGALIGAFNSLEETPLEFLYLDEVNFFNDSTDLSDWTSDGSANQTVSGGSIGLTNTSGNLNYFYNLRTYKENQVLVKIDNPTLSTTATMTIMLKRLSSGNYLGVKWDQSANTLTVIKVVSGTPTTLKTISLSGFLYSSSLWIRASIFNNTVWAEAWGTEPDVIGYPDYNTNVKFDTHTLSAGDTTTYGSAVSANAGFIFTTNNLNVDIDTVEVQSLNPGDLRIVGRKIGKIEMTESQTTNTVRRDFLITFRSSTGRLESRVESKYRFTNQGAKILGFNGTPLTFPLDGTGLVLGASLATVNNVGVRNIPVRMVFGVTNIEFGVGNATTNEFILATPEVLNFEIDTGRRRFIDAALGTNMYSNFGTVHDWVKMIPGNNNFSFGIEATLSEMLLFWRPAF